MIEELPVQEPGIGGFKANGKLSDAIYQQFKPRLEEMIHVVNAPVFEHEYTSVTRT